MSRKHSKFDAKDAFEKWKSFKTNDKRDPLTLRSLIEIVKGTRHAKNTVELVPEDEEDTRTLDDLDLDGEADDGVPNPGGLPALPWRSMLDLTEQGAVKPTLPNVIKILTNDPRSNGVLGWNEWASKIVLRRTPGRFRAREGAAKPPFQLAGKEWTCTDPANGCPIDNVQDLSHIAGRGGSFQDS